VEETERLAVLRLSGEVQAREQLIRSTVESLSEGVVALDRAGRIVAWNRAMEERYDVAARQVTRRVNFTKGSKPHMLRASPDGKYVWVQNARTDTNEILDGQTLQVLNAQPVGKVPTTNAWTPDGRHSYLLHAGDNHLIIMEAQPPFRQLKRIEVGPGPGNVSFRPDGKYAYVTVGGLNAVAVIDTAAMAVHTMLPAGRTPSGIVLLTVRPRL
jgi:YVTN family beta-propeller protein